MALPSARSLTARLVVAAGLWCLFVLAAGGLMLSGLFRDAMERNFDARLSAELDNLIAAAETAPGPRIVLTRELGDPRYERAYSGWYWQVRGPDGTVVRSRSLWDGELATRPPGTVAEGTSAPALGPNEEDIRVLSRPVLLPGSERPFEFSVAGATSEMRAASARFNRALILSLAALGAGLLVALLVQVRFGLSPLREMGRALGAIRTGARERLEGVFPAEVQPLANELNALLDQNARVVDRARTHVGNLAHGLKTPLTVLKNATRDLPAPTGHVILHQLELMQEQIDRYLARARVAGPVGLHRGRTPVRSVVLDLERTLHKIYRDRALRVEFTGDDDLAFAGDAQDLQEILGNVLDNAFKWGRERIRVAVTPGPVGSLEVSIADDGPGLDPDRRASVLERGRRVDESTPGSGLGLDIARDITELHGGRIRLESAPEGGLLVVVRLPAVVPT